MDPDHLDELEFLAMESPRSMIEIYRTDLLALIELAREALMNRDKDDE